MSRKQWIARACTHCGAPSDHRRVCSRCDPKRATREHRDKYAGRARG